MKKRILVIPGDGIGPEVTKWGQKVLECIGEKFGHEFSFDYGIMGHIAIEKTGKPLPEETLEKAKNSDAILFGAIGHPKYDNDPTAKVRPEQGLLAIRKELGLFANIRPIKLFDELLNASPIKPEVLKGSDILFFRELTGGIYFGKPQERRDNGNTAVDTCIYTREEITRIAKLAFDFAMKRRKKLTLVDKANVLETSRLWREVVQEVAKSYPEVETSYMFVDAMSMALIRSPTKFDVILTENMFGDILTDEASQIAGSMGMLASASIGSKVGLYEPIHGSAPDIAGKGIANPIASVLSAALLLEIAFGMKKESESIVNAIDKTLKNGYRTIDISDINTDTSKILSTDEIGEKIIERI